MTSTENHHPLDQLPLGWTRVRRKRKTDLPNKNGDQQEGNDGEQDCCVNDEFCSRQQQHKNKRPRSDATETTGTKSASSLITGKAIFCLHDTDPSWVQGYFFPKSGAASSLAAKPWGLLAVKEEIDDCMACADGGYRQVRLKIYKPGPTRPQRTDEPIQVSNIDWTGGDMMRLSHDDIQMETDRLFAGSSALPYLDKYFERTLIQQLRKECHVEKDLPILEWMPDVVVLVGSMSISSSAVVAVEKVKNDANKPPVEATDDDDNF